MNECAMNVWMKMMAKFKKFEVEIGTNGHIKYKDKIIAVLAQWNKYEDLETPTKRIIKK